MFLNLHKFKNLNIYFLYLINKIINIIVLKNEDNLKKTILIKN